VSLAVFSETFDVFALIYNLARVYPLVVHNRYVVRIKAVSVKKRLKCADKLSPGCRSLSDEGVCFLEIELPIVALANGLLHNFSNHELVFLMVLSIF